MWTTREAERFVREWKTNHPCCDCSDREGRPVFHPYYMTEFDHIPGSKVFGLHRARGYSEEEIRNELSKCEVLCANCHRQREHDRRMLRRLQKRADL